MADGRKKYLLLATSVLVVPYRHPLLTARVSAMLHEISGGRFALGVGVGWSATEFQALGTAGHPINPGRAWLEHSGLPALRRESQRAGAHARHGAQDQVPARGRTSRRP